TWGVGGWLGPAGGTCSRNVSSPSASIKQTCPPACASASDRQSPTGPAPITITRLEDWSMRRTRVRPAHRHASGYWMPAFAGMTAIGWLAVPASILRRRHVLHGTDPTGVGEVEHDAEWILVFRLIIGVCG